MSAPFITRPPTPDELEYIRLAFSTFCDGSGMTMLENGQTVPGWRDIERALAATLGGIAPEGKQIFDVFLPSTENPAVVYGVSAKSKELSRKTAIADLEGDGRVYMEMANSPAKFWALLRPTGVTESDFLAQRHAEKIGPAVLNLVEKWHQEDAAKYAMENPGKTISLADSAYLTVSNSKGRKAVPRQYQIHSFDLSFPAGITWKFNSSACLRGFDPSFPDEVLLDWYGLSGGQLKYYPRASTARYKSPPFTLVAPHQLDLVAKIARYWPSEFHALGRSYKIPPLEYAEELDRLEKLQAEPAAVAIIREAAAKLRSLAPKK